MEPLISAYGLLLSDLDGVVYRGSEGISANIDALNRAEAEGVQLGYITNNASRNHAEIAAQLSSYGLPSSHAEIMTPSQSIVPLLAEFLSPGDPVLIVGGPGLHEIVSEAGYRDVSSVDEHPRAVVQGFTASVNLGEITQISYAVQTGIPWLATNDDRSVPKERGIAPGNGAMVQAVFWATGQYPRVAGKPERPIYDAALARWPHERALFIGDRLDTDILGARRAYIDSVMVFTGIGTAKEVLAAGRDRRPLYVVDDLSQLFSPYPAAHRDADGVLRMGGALPSSSLAPHGVDWRSWRASRRTSTCSARRANSSGGRRTVSPAAPFRARSGTAGSLRAPRPDAARRLIRRRSRRRSPLVPSLLNGFPRRG